MILEHIIIDILVKKPDGYGILLEFFEILKEFFKNSADICFPDKKIKHAHHFLSLNFVREPDDREKNSSRIPIENRPEFCPLKFRYSEKATKVCPIFHLEFDTAK